MAPTVSSIVVPLSCAICTLKRPGAPAVSASVGIQCTSLMPGCLRTLRSHLGDAGVLRVLRRVPRRACASTAARPSRRARRSSRPARPRSRSLAASSAAVRPEMPPPTTSSAGAARPSADCRPAPSSSSVRRRPCARSRRPSPGAVRRARRRAATIHSTPSRRLARDIATPGKWKASVLARREQAAMHHVRDALASRCRRGSVARRRRCTGSRARAPAPSCLPSARPSRAARCRALADAAARADIGGSLHFGHADSASAQPCGRPGSRAAPPRWRSAPSG